MEEFRRQRAAATPTLTVSLPAKEPPPDEDTTPFTVAAELPKQIQTEKEVDVDVDVDVDDKEAHKGSEGHSQADHQESHIRDINATPSASVLQQHIDELTTEKFSLQRSVEQQQALVQRLANENEELTRRLNGITAAMEAMELEVETRRREVATARTHVQSAMAERDAFELSAREASERASSLATEVVALEEKVLTMKGNELRELNEREELTNGLLRENEEMKEHIQQLKEELQKLQKLQETRELAPSARLVSQLRDSNLLSDVDKAAQVVDCLPPNIKALLPVPIANGRKEGFDFGVDFDLEPSVHELVGRIYQHLEKLEAGVQGED